MVKGIFGRVLALAAVLVLSIAVVATALHDITPLKAAGQPVSGVAVPQDTPGPPLYPGAPTYQYPPGVAAITPRLPSSNAGTTAQATFTTEDARTFVLTHGLFRDDSGAALSIVRSDIITAGEASKLLNGEQIGRPPTSLVAVVELHGNFSAGGSVPYGTPPMHFHTGWALFDATTGNYLLGGFSP